VNHAHNNGLEICTETPRPGAADFAEREGLVTRGGALVPRRCAPPLGHSECSDRRRRLGGRRAPRHADECGWLGRGRYVDWLRVRFGNTVQTLGVWPWRGLPNAAVGRRGGSLAREAHSSGCGTLFWWWQVTAAAGGHEAVARANEGLHEQLARETADLEERPPHESYTYTGGPS
jgi:hypothetical protein